VTDQAKKQLLPWTTRACDASVQSGSLLITPAGGQPFLTNAKLNATGPVEVKVRIRTAADGTGRLQWRTEGQATFPVTGQTTSFDVRGGDWQELAVPLAVEGRLVHVRLFPPVQEKPVEIDWIEIGPVGADDEEHERWDFQETAEPN
jgi:hypothetical protein